MLFPKMRRMRSLRHTYAIGTYNAGQSGSPIVSNPYVGESSCDRNSSYHDLKAHISYVCIYWDALTDNAEEAKRKDQLRSADPILFLQ